MNKIQAGDKIPSFAIKDQNGNDFDISSLLGRKSLLYFSSTGWQLKSHKRSHLNNYWIRCINFSNATFVNVKPPVIISEGYSLKSSIRRFVE
jgi:hypothetical protein